MKWIVATLLMRCWVRFPLQQKIRVASSIGTKDQKDCEKRKEMGDLAVLLNLPNSNFAHFIGELGVVSLNGFKIFLNTPPDPVDGLCCLDG